MGGEKRRPGTDWKDVLTAGMELLARAQENVSLRCFPEFFVKDQMMQFSAVVTRKVPLPPQKNGFIKIRLKRESVHLYKDFDSYAKVWEIELTHLHPWSYNHTRNNLHSTATLKKTNISQLQSNSVMQTELSNQLWTDSYTLPVMHLHKLQFYGIKSFLSFKTSIKELYRHDIHYFSH